MQIEVIDEPAMVDALGLSHLVQVVVTKSPFVASGHSQRGVGPTEAHEPEDLRLGPHVLMSTSRETSRRTSPCWGGPRGGSTPRDQARIEREPKLPAAVSDSAHELVCTRGRSDRAQPKKALAWWACSV
jgi:hypothetical protein